MQDVINGVCNGTLPLKGTHNYELSGLQGIPKYFDDYTTLLTDGYTGNLGVTYLGSYSLDYSVANGVVEIRVYNSSTAASGFRPPYLGYTPWWNSHVAPVVNSIFSSGRMSKTEQYFIFHENLAGRVCSCKVE